MIREAMERTSPSPGSADTSATPVPHDADAPPATAPATPDSQFCPECGYDLRGSADSSRCPECGLTIDREELGVSRVPWTHRRRIGRVRAYWRTVGLATFQTRRLSAEVIRPVDYRDAQRFRLVTSAIVAVFLIAAASTAVAMQGVDRIADDIADVFDAWTSAGQPSAGLDLALPLAAAAMLPPVVPAAIVLFTLAVTGVASYWFHPSSQPVVRQNRAVAIGHYACAPLAFLPLPILLFFGPMALVAAGVNAEAVRPLWHSMALLAYPLFLMIPVWWYVTTLRLLRGAAGASTGRMWAAAIAIPLTWLLTAVLTLVVVPWLVGFVWLVIDSLR